MFSLRRKFFSLLIAVIMLVGIMSVPGTVVQATGMAYYVDGTNGNDNNNGTSTGTAFKTIQKAADVAGAGDTVYIRGGTYHETEAITPANSGTSANRIKFTNYNGETVTVSGAEPVTGWTQESANIYYASMNWNLNDKNQVFINNIMANEARWPNGAGTVLATPAFSSFADVDSSADNTHITDLDLTGSDDDWNDATLYIMSGSEWIALTSTITDYDASTKTLTYDPFMHQSGWYNPITGNYYYLSGLKSMLDSQNEWWYDSDNSRLYMYSATNPSNVEAKRRDVAFNLSDRHYITIEGLNTIASTIVTNDSTTNCQLKKLNCKYISYSDLLTYESEQVGLGIQLCGSYNELRDSELQYSSSSLVNVEGTYNNVINCYIHDGCYVPCYEALVNLRGKYSLISHNTICDSGSRTLCSDGSSQIYKNEIQYNRIYNCGWYTRDLGLLYFSATDGQGTDIHHNIISGNKSRHDALGIYLDMYCYNFLIHHNIIYDVPDQPIHCNTSSEYNLIYNNTAWNEVGVCDICIPLNNFGAYGTRAFNNIVTNYSDYSSSAILGSNITSNPAFTNESAYDFTLQPGSAAINAGVDEAGITDDCTDGLPDCGAIEHGSSAFSAGHNFSSPPNPTYSPSLPKHRNLVNNGGFELNNLTSWTKTDEQSGVITNYENWTHAANEGESMSQQRGLRLGGSSNADGVEQTITGLEANTTYIATCWLRSPNGATAEFGVRDYGGTVKTESSTSNNWTFMQITFTTGTGSTSAKLYFKKTSSSTDYIYCDDAAMQFLGNTIPNGSFEYADNNNKPVDWTIHTEATYMDGNSISSDIAYDGSKSLKIADTSSSMASGVSSMSFPATARKFYESTVYCFVSSGSAAYYMEYYDSSDTRISAEAILCATTGSWQQLKVSGTAPAGTTSIRLLCYSLIGNTGISYFDSATFKEAVPNSSFESEDGNNKPVDWTIHTEETYMDGNFVSSDRAYDGSKSLKIADTSSSLASGVSSMSFPATAGKFYESTVYCYVSSGSAAYYMEYYDSSDTRISAEAILCTTTGSWQQLKVSGTAPAGTTSIKLLCYSLMTNTGTSYFDSATFKEAVPNSSFEYEDGNNKPVDWTNHTEDTYMDGNSVSLDKAYDGSESLKIDDTSASLASGVSSKSFAATAGKYYLSSIYCYVSSGSITYLMEYYDASDTRISAEYVICNVAGSWQKLIVSGRAPAGTAYIKLLCYSSMGNTGTSYFDLASFAECGAN